MQDQIIHKESIWTKQKNQCNSNDNVVKIESKSQIKSISKEHY